MPTFRPMTMARYRRCWESTAKLSSPPPSTDFSIAAARHRAARHRCALERPRRDRHGQLLVWDPVSKSSIGWIWVGAQAVLLLALVALPTRDDWPFPFLLTVLAGLLFFGGLILAAVAALGLGSSLTPTPVPNQAGELQTKGLYRFMRHPIYTCLLYTSPSPRDGLLSRMPSSA